jgi:hypothetical protein
MYKDYVLKAWKQEINPHSWSETTPCRWQIKMLVRFQTIYV